MKTRHRGEGQTFGPESLKALGQAFDELWQEIKERYGDRAHVVEAARQDLARCLFAIATDESRDVEALKALARRAMALRPCCATQSRLLPDTRIVRVYHRQRA
jgi:hypothetical protein